MKLLTRPEELILLAVLHLTGEAYCVPIHRRISQVTRDNWSLGSVYMPLDRLVKKGYLHSHLSDSTPERGGRQKRIYAVTPLGIRALKKIQDVESQMRAGLSGILEEI